METSRQNTLLGKRRVALADAVCHLWKQSNPQNASGSGSTTPKCVHWTSKLPAIRVATPCARKGRETY